MNAKFQLKLGRVGIKAEGLEYYNGLFFATNSWGVSLYVHDDICYSVHVYPALGRLLH